MSAAFSDLKRRAAALTVLACLVILAVSQMIIPAARMAAMLGENAGISGAVMIAASGAAAGKSGIASQLRHCVTVKLGEIRIDADLPQPSLCTMVIAEPTADTVPAGLPPDVLTPPPRPA